MTAWVTDIRLACVAFSGSRAQSRSSSESEAKTALSQSFGRHRWHLGPNREQKFFHRDIWAELSYGTFAHEWYSRVGWIKDRRLLLEHLLNHKIKLFLKRGDQILRVLYHSVEELILMLSEAILSISEMRNKWKDENNCQGKSWNFCLMWTLWSESLMQETCELNLMDGVRVTRLN